MLSFANAKINLGLHIVNKRPDGYHDIETVFYPVQVYDVVEITQSKNGLDTFQVQGLTIPGSANNLCERALSLLKQDYEIEPLAIHLIKNIPIGAGLGGGSADAAAVLKLVNDTCKLNIKTEQLKIYAQQLGADCPFFIDNKPTYATGIGTDLTGINLDLEAYEFVIIHPNIHISTVQAYQNVQAQQAPIDIRDILKLPIQEWKYYLKNDFEDGIFDLHPIIKQVKGELYSAGALYASMSGSGSAVFGIFEKQIDLSHLAKYGTIYYPIDL